MTPPPSLGNIRDDDELLDALGGRRAPSQTDHVGDLLASWVTEIDSTDAAAHKKRRPRMAHLAAATGLAVTALSVSSMAAAVTDYRVPVLYQLGSVAGSVLGSPLHAAGGGGGSEPAPEQGLPAATSETSEPSDEPSPSTTSTGTKPTDLPRSTTSPRPSTHEKTTHDETTAHHRPPANPAPTSTPDSPSSPDRPSHSPSRPSTSTSTPSSSSSTGSSSTTTKPEDSSSSTDPTSPTPTPTESGSQSNSVSPQPTDPDRTRPTLPQSSTSPSTSGDGPLDELEKVLPLPPTESSAGR